jgi:hypothetical protein
MPHRRIKTALQGAAVIWQFDNAEWGEARLWIGSDSERVMDDFGIPGGNVVGDVTVYA